MIVDRINAYLDTQGKELDESILIEVEALAGNAFRRQFGLKEEREQKSPYFSSIGKCLRQQAYNLLGFPAEGKAIDARARMVFFQGDMVELAIVMLARVAGCAITAYGVGQESIEWEGLRGRPDGILDGTHLVEVKSMSSYSFDDFQNNILDIGYRYQCNAGMEALGLSHTVIVALNKDAGVLAEMVIPKDPEIIKDIRARLATLKAATKENLPERPYAPNDKGFYPWQCRYCAFYRTCLPNAELVLKGNAYKLYERKQKEITQ